MTFAGIADLAANPEFAARVNACCTQQADIYKDDQRPDFVALSHDVMKGAAGPLMAFTRQTAAAPGLADKAEQPNGEIDQTLVEDGDILSAVQANWQDVAGLYFNEDGTPKP